MFDLDIEHLLTAIENGDVSPDEALRRLRRLAFADLGFAKVDHHRSARLGFPEVIYCEGKKASQIESIARELLDKNDVLLATRADEAAFDAIRKAAPDADFRREARAVVVDRRSERQLAGSVVVACAGTSDLPVAEEAAITAELMGSKTTLLADVGVAGLHRLLAFEEKLANARAIVAVAGMDGALPSVIGGLVSAPVIAVPTSVGYGASFRGLSALLTMLNSCAPGVAVVNIDNGFGAGYLAAVINAMAEGWNRGADVGK